MLINEEVSISMVKGVGAKLNTESTRFKISQKAMSILLDMPASSYRLWTIGEIIPPSTVFLRGYSFYKSVKDLPDGFFGSFSSMTSEKVADEIRGSLNNKQ